MPFTLAHPAAAVPCRRVLGRAGVLSALIVGSVIPDLPYFLPLGVVRAYSHSLAGLFVFCLPLGLLAYLVWHGVLRPPVTFLLPTALRERVPQLAEGTWCPAAPWWAVLVSLLVGAATHVLWDAWTHDDGFVVQDWPALLTVLWNIGGYRVTIYKLLQHGGTCVGLGCLTYWSWQWMRTAPLQAPTAHWQPPDATRRPAWLLSLLAPGVGGVIAGLLQIKQATGIWALQRFVVQTAVIALMLLGALLLSFGALWRLWAGWHSLSRVRP